MENRDLTSQSHRKRLLATATMTQPRKLSPMEEAWLTLEPVGPPAGTDVEEEGVDGDAVGGNGDGEEAGDNV